MKRILLLSSQQVVMVRQARLWFSMWASGSTSGSTLSTFTKRFDLSAGNAAPTSCPCRGLRRSMSSRVHRSPGFYFGRAHLVMLCRTPLAAIIYFSGCSCFCLALVAACCKSSNQTGLSDDQSWSKVFDWLEKFLWLSGHLWSRYASRGLPKAFHREK